MFKIQKGVTFIWQNGQATNSKWQFNQTGFSNRPVSVGWFENFCPKRIRSKDVWKSFLFTKSRAKVEPKMTKSVFFVNVIKLFYSLTFGHNKLELLNPFKPSQTNVGKGRSQP